MSTKQKKSKSLWALSHRKKFFSWLTPLASIRLTLALLSFSMVLIFVATLEQVKLGIRGAQAEYFESLVGIWNYPDEFWGGGKIIPRLDKEIGPVKSYDVKTENDSFWFKDHGLETGDELLYLDEGSGKAIEGLSRNVRYFAIVEENSNDLFKLATDKSSANAKIAVSIKDSGSGEHKFLKVFRFPFPIPGGYLLGGLLIVNLTAAFIVRFQWSVRKFGIQLIHLGIIMLLVGQLVTQAIQEESRMQINKGESSNYIERFHGVELALTDVTDPNKETVVSIPQKLLENGGFISSEDLPFDVKVTAFGPNCDFDVASSKDKREGPVQEVDQGVGHSANLSIKPKSEDYSSEAMNFGYLVFELSDESGKLGTWLALAHPAGNHWWKESPKLADLAFQPIRHKGKLWGVSLRAQREYLPYSIELLGIANEFYQGTETPFNFESDVLIKMDGNDTRRALVYMNTPLRHEGKTFYQYQMNKAADYTVFQVIRNPSWLVPYLACIIVSIGLLWQFGFHLVRFLRKNSLQKA